MTRWMILLLPLLACGDAADADGDGYPATEDCDDADADVNPAAVEVCNGKDDDCDNLTDDPTAEGTSIFYIDEDGDGWGTREKDRNGDGTPDSGVVRTCAQPAGFSDKDGDCDDDDDSVFPGSGCP